jgi:catechol 2,3-dioxygenase-like lactoylglutathione lyase family enzyme
MSIELSQSFITINDADSSLVFYRDLLGLELRNDVASGGFRWLTLAAPDQSVEIVLEQAMAGRPEQDGEALLTLVTKGSLHGAHFRTGDLDTTFEKIRAGGAEVLQEPMQQPWGVKDCAFRDPSGNVIRINQA